jgi:hypothetical protein
VRDRRVDGLHIKRQLIDAAVGEARAVESEIAITRDIDGSGACRKGRRWLIVPVLLYKSK